MLEQVWDGPAVLFEFLEGCRLQLMGDVLNSGAASPMGSV